MAALVALKYINILGETDRNIEQRIKTFIPIEKKILLNCINIGTCIEEVKFFEIKFSLINLFCDIDDSEMSQFKEEGFEKFKILIDEHIGLWTNKGFNVSRVDDKLLEELFNSFSDYGFNLNYGAVTYNFWELKIPYKRFVGDIKEEELCMLFPTKEEAEEALNNISRELEDFYINVEKYVRYL